MQTFLPDDDCERNACPLDAERLGKQPVEAIKVVRAITVPGYEWASHSAALSGGASIRRLSDIRVCRVQCTHSFFRRRTSLRP